MGQVQAFPLIMCASVQVYICVSVHLSVHFYVCMCCIRWHLKKQQLFDAN